MKIKNRNAREFYRLFRHKACTNLLSLYKFTFLESLQWHLCKKFAEWEPCLWHTLQGVYCNSVNGAFGSTKDKLIFLKSLKFTRWSRSSCYPYVGDIKRPQNTTCLRSRIFISLSKHSSTPHEFRKWFPSLEIAFMVFYVLQSTMWTSI